jgi:hypothetical protein
MEGRDKIMSKNRKNHPAAKRGKQEKSTTPLWVRIVAIGIAVVILGTAIPVTLLFFH